MEAYTDSVEASQQRMTAAIEEFVLDLNGSDAIKTFYDSLTFLIENVETLGLVLSALAIYTNGDTIASYLGGSLSKIGTKAILMGTPRERGTFQSGFAGIWDNAKQAHYANQQARYGQALEANIQFLNLQEQSIARAIQDDFLLGESKQKLSASQFLLTTATGLLTEEAYNLALGYLQGSSIQGQKTLAAKLALNAESDLVRLTLEAISASDAVELTEEQLKIVLDEYIRQVQSSTGALRGGTASKVMGGNLGSAGSTQQSALVTGIGGISSSVAGGLGGLVGFKATESLGPTALILGGTLGGMVGQKAASSLVAAFATKVGAGAMAGPIGALVAMVGVGIMTLVKNAQKKAIENAQTEFKELENNYTNAKSAEVMASKIDELSYGVDSLGRNISLTDEEYEKFIDYNKQLADALPQLGTYVDAEGNKFVLLSDDVSSVTEEIQNLKEEAQKELDLKAFSVASGSGGKSIYSDAFNTNSEARDDILKNQEETLFDRETMEANIIHMERIINDLTEYGATEEELAPYYKEIDYFNELIEEIDKELLRIEGDLDETDSNMKDYAQMATRTAFEDDYYNNWSDNQKAFAMLVAGNTTIKDDMSPSEYIEAVENNVSKAMEAIGNNERALSLALKLEEGTTIGESRELKLELANTLLTIFGDNLDDEGTLDILLGLGFEVKDGEVVSATEDIKDKLLNELGEGGEKLLNDLGIDDMTEEEGKSLYNMVSKGLVTSASSAAQVQNMVALDNWGRNSYEDSKRYTNYLRNLRLGDVDEQGNVTNDYGSRVRDLLTEADAREKGDVLSIEEITSQFADAPEHVREGIKKIADEVNNGTKEVEEGVEELVSALDVTIENSQFEEAKKAAAEVFSSIDAGEDGILGEWSELQQVMEALADTFERLGSAQEEQAAKGRLSWQTTLDLLAADENYINALEVVNGQIRLRGNATEIMAKILVEATKESIRAKIAELEQEKASIAQLLTELGVTDMAIIQDQELVATTGDVVEALQQEAEAVHALTVQKVAENMADLGAIDTNSAVSAVPSVKGVTPHKAQAKTLSQEQKDALIADLTRRYNEIDDNIDIYNTLLKDLDEFGIGGYTPDQWESKFKTYDASQTEEEDPLEAINATLDHIQRAVDKLVNSKPLEWASKVDDSGNVLVTAIDRINQYYAKMDGFYKDQYEAAVAFLNTASNLTQDQINEITDRANEALKNIRDNAIQNLEDIKTFQESVYSALTNEVNRYISQLEKQKEIIEESYEIELERLKNKEESLERQNKLIELLNNLLTAQKEKERVYREGKIQKPVPSIKIAQIGENPEMDNTEGKTCKQYLQVPVTTIIYE